MIKQYNALKTQTFNAIRESDCGEITSQQDRKLPLKLEVKFDLKSFRGETDVEKLNPWLKQQDVFFRVQKVKYYKEKIEIIAHKLEGYALVQWKAYYDDVNIGEEFFITRGVSKSYYKVNSILFSTNKMK